MNFASISMIESTRRRFSGIAPALAIVAGFYFILAPLAPRAQDAFMQSLESAIDQTLMTPRERLGLRLFFDSNLSEPSGLACASCHDPRRAFTGNNNTMIGVA